METIIGLLQKNLLDTRRWETREELRLAIVTWIETKYDRRRPQRALGKLTIHQAFQRTGQPLADRMRLRGTTMSASSSTGCGMPTKHRRLPLLAATLARDGGR
jgi:hypothetical protein